jgi:hypothetical protein
MMPFWKRVVYRAAPDRGEGTGLAAARAAGT